MTTKVNLTAELTNQQEILDASLPPVPWVFKVNRLSNTTEIPRRDDIAELLKSGGIGLTYGDINGSSKLLVSMLDHYGVWQFKTPEDRKEYMALNLREHGWPVKGSDGAVVPHHGSGAEDKKAQNIIVTKMENGSAPNCKVRGLGDDIGDIGGDDLLILQIYNQLSNQSILISDHFGFVENGVETVSKSDKYHQFYSNYGKIVATTLRDEADKTLYAQLMAEYRHKSKFIDYVEICDARAREKKKIDIYCHGHCDADTIKMALKQLQISLDNGIDLNSVDGLIIAINTINTTVAAMTPEQFSAKIIEAMKAYQTDWAVNNKVSGILALVGNNYDPSRLNSSGPIRQVLHGHDHFGNFWKPVQNDISLDVDSYADPYATSGLPPVKFTLEKYDPETMSNEEKQIVNRLLAMINMYEDATAEVATKEGVWEGRDKEHWDFNCKAIAAYEQSPGISEMLEANKNQGGQLGALAKCAESLRNNYHNINKVLNDEKVMHPLAVSRAQIRFEDQSKIMTEAKALTEIKAKLSTPEERMKAVISYADTFKRLSDAQKKLDSCNEQILQDERQQSSATEYQEVLAALKGKIEDVVIFCETSDELKLIMDAATGFGFIQEKDRETYAADNMVVNTPVKTDYESALDVLSNQNITKAGVEALCGILKLNENKFTPLKIRIIGVLLNNLQVNKSPNRNSYLFASLKDQGIEVLLDNWYNPDFKNLQVLAVKTLLENQWYSPIKDKLKSKKTEISKVLNHWQDKDFAQLSVQGLKTLLEHENYASLKNKGISAFLENWQKPEFFILKSKTTEISKVLNHWQDKDFAGLSTQALTTLLDNEEFASIKAKAVAALLKNTEDSEFAKKIKTKGEEMLLNNWQNQDFEAPKIAFLKKMQLVNGGQPHPEFQNLGNQLAGLIEDSKYESLEQPMQDNFTNMTKAAKSSLPIPIITRVIANTIVDMANDSSMANNPGKQDIIDRAKELDKAAKNLANGNDVNAVTLALGLGKLIGRVWSWFVNAEKFVAEKTAKHMVKAQSWVYQGSQPPPVSTVSQTQTVNQIQTANQIEIESSM